MEINPAPSPFDVNSDILNAFHLMWDSFPAPAALLRKDRTVLACNPAAVAIGYRDGARCFQTFGDKGVHKHCRANEALREGVAQRSVVYSPARQTVGDSYWVPLPGSKDLFVHTVINITQYAKPELFQE
jgi:hypothetical protein